MGKTKTSTQVLTQNLRRLTCPGPDGVEGASEKGTEKHRTNEVEVRLLAVRLLEESSIQITEGKKRP